MAEIDTLFQDGQGGPQFVDCAVLFLDLLGTSNERDNDKALDQLRRTKRGVAEARRLNPKDDGSTLWHMTWFSDNLGLHYAIAGPFGDTQAVGLLITDVGYMQLAFLEEALLARGAVAVGPYYADDEFIHGPALEQAVELEKEEARFPRVVLSEKAVAIAYKGLVKEYGGGMTAPWRTQLLVDEDGMVFVDYLATLTEAGDEPKWWQKVLKQHCTLIAKGLADFEDAPHVLCKYRWLAAYHNDFIDRYRAYLRSAGDEHLVDCGEPIGSFLPFGRDIEEVPEERIGD